MECNRSVFFFLLLLLSGVAESGKVLFFAPFVSKSMVITYKPIMKELAKKGHQVLIPINFYSLSQTKGMS
jgi:hypothetical protein